LFYDRKSKNGYRKMAAKSVKFWSSATPIYTESLITFPGKLPAKFGVQNGVVGGTTRKSAEFLVGAPRILSLFSTKNFIRKVWRDRRIQRCKFAVSDTRNSKYRSKDT
jgi:hypothetical protein